MGTLDIQSYIYLALLALLLLILVMVAIYHCCIASRHEQGVDNTVVLSKQHYNQMVSRNVQLERDKQVYMQHSSYMGNVCKLLSEEKANLENKIKELSGNVLTTMEMMTLGMYNAGVHPGVTTMMVSQMLALQKRVCDVARIPMPTTVQTEKTDQSTQTGVVPPLALDQVLATDVQNNGASQSVS